MTDLVRKVEEAIRDILIKELGQIVIWHEPFLARAAIEAMRGNATPAMIVAGEKVAYEGDPYNGHNPAGIWDAMIDTALS